MSDNTENEDEFDVIEGEEPKEAPAAEVDADDDDEDDGDERLSTSQDDDEGEVESQSRKRRVKRREIQKRAKESSQRELEMLRHQNGELARRMAAIEGNNLANNVSAIDQRFNQVQNEVRQAEQIIARAVEAGNGDDVATAMRLRDEAQREAQQLWNHKQQVEQVRQQHANPGPDPRTVNYAKEWLSANPWYDPSGRDEDSAVTKAIDNGLVAAGYDPTSRSYWEELTRRVATRVGGGEAAAPEAGSPRRKAPPQGQTREHAPTSTRKEVYVTPARKQAMVDAGIWDDVARRNQMLKAYQAYDKNGSAN
ncbi:MAG: hypothetical protein WCI05_02935 [Myxococcales bacterium]